MNSWIVFALGAAVVLGAVYPLYAGERLHGHPAIRTAVKGAGTLIAAGMALHGTVQLPETASWLIVAGLAVCAVADVALNVHFLAGMGIFWGGHVLYCGAFLQLIPFQPMSLVVYALLCLLCAALFSPSLRGKGWRVLPYVVYGSALLFMLSVALLLPGLLGPRGLVAAIGALLFTVSDLLIARGQVKQTMQHQTWWVMGLYYCAQLLLSLVSLQPWLG